MSKRTIFIGDIHGCYDEFKLLLKRLDIKKSDKVYIVGDMINKGPKSFKVLKFLYKNKDQFKAILGNHEVGFIEYLNGSEKYKNKTFKKLKNKLEENPKIQEFLVNLPYYIEEKDFIMIHAGIKNGIKLEKQDKNILTMVREIDGKLWYKKYSGDKKVIYGHNALDGLQIREKTIGLDSGCVYGKSLSAYILETGEVFSQNALDNYISIYKRKNNFLKKIVNLIK